MSKDVNEKIILSQSDTELAGGYNNFNFFTSKPRVSSLNASWNKALRLLTLKLLPIINKLQKKVYPAYNVEFRW